MIAALSGHLRRVEVSSLADNTFRARLTFEQAGRELAIDIRPSDAVALGVVAVHYGPIPFGGAARVHVNDSARRLNLGWTLVLCRTSRRSALSVRCGGRGGRCGSGCGFLQET